MNNSDWYQGRRGQMVQAYRACGLTMAAFARRERLNYATFAGWVAKAAQRGVVASDRLSLPSC